MGADARARAAAAFPVNQRDCVLGVLGSQVRRAGWLNYLSTSRPHYLTTSDAPG
jgi:hypothetical protein